MNRRITALLALTTTILVALPAASRDEHLHFPLQDALATADAKAMLDPQIRLFFGDQPFAKPIASFGTFTSNKKTNFANKSDKAGCERAFLSAALSLQQRAKREGGNAIVHIKSVYRNADFSSSTEYECGAGHIMGGVALRGEVVKLP